MVRAGLRHPRMARPAFGTDRGYEMRNRPPGPILVLVAALVTLLVVPGSMSATASYVALVSSAICCSSPLQNPTTLASFRSLSKKPHES